MNCKNEELIDKDICPICHGDTFVIENRNGDIYAIPCKCREKVIAESKLRFANIPTKYNGFAKDDFNANIYSQAESKKLILIASKCINYYMQEFERFKEISKGLYIWSNQKGSGKTMMAAIIANELIKNYVVKFATASAILNEIRASYDKKSEISESQIVHDLINTNILVIDDFGLEVDPKAWVNDKYFYIINERYINNRVTIFTSNDSIANLQYDPRIISRIKENVIEIHFPEESVRDIIAKSDTSKFIEGVKGEI